MNQVARFIRVAGLTAWCLTSMAVTGAEPLTLLDPAGKEHRILEPGQAAATVVVFVQPDCPIANQYAPVLRRLHRDYPTKGVSMFLVYPDKDLAAKAILRHQRDFDMEGTALLDPEHRLVKRTGATVTPEAVVFDRNGRQVYRGRIDNRYVDFGRKRPRPTRHDLKESLDAVLAGQPVPEATTKAVGCYIYKAQAPE